ncbi:hypothetical protein N9D49_00930 [bacterium]|nr:hypothetical protein [bacterium]
MSEETTNTAEQTPAELTVQDLGSIKQIIDVASQRGAFKPNEMMTVGQVYTKLDTFLAAVQKQQQETAPTEEATQEKANG